MKLTNCEWWRAGIRGTLCWIVLGLLMTGFASSIGAQGVSTTTVQGTVYLANGRAGAGTLVVSWPSFVTAAGQAVAADRLTVTIPTDGYVSVNLAPNVGALPAGQYYTAVFYMSDGTVSTQYWQVPAAAQASLAQVKTQVMPAAQAVQAVSKAYVDQSISQLTQSLLTASGGTLSGPLYLSADPTQALQAATKHYVDTQVSTAVPLAGGNMTGALGTPAVNGVESPAVGSSQTTLQAAMNAAGTNGSMEIPPTYAGSDTFTNPNGVRVTDLRTQGSQQTERSVKEFGAVCDGVTDDTSALQAALNYANTHGVALTIPEGICKTRTLNWHGESIGGLGKQVSALKGFPGQDVLASATDATNLMQYTRLHDLTIYVDQSVDVSCSTAKGRAAAGSCQVNRPMEANSIFSAGGNGLTNTAGTGTGWAVGNCAIAMPASTGAGGNGLRVAAIENVEIVTTGADPMAAQYPGAHSTHTCGIYAAQWPQWSEFRNIDIRGLNTGIAIPALPVGPPAGLNADSNRWQNVTIQATHALTVAAGSNNVVDNLVALVSNSAATGEAPTGLVLDFAGAQQGWTVRNAVVVPTWNAVAPSLTVTASGGAVTAVALGSEHGLGWDPYGTSVPLVFSGSCTAQGTAAVNSDGAIASVSVTQGGVGCSSTTTVSLNAAGTWDTAAPVNLITGQSMSFFAGNLVKGNGGYTVWNATGGQSFGTQMSGGGGNLPGGGSYPAIVATSSVGSTLDAAQFAGVDFGAKLQACLNTVNKSYGGTCDARNFTGNQQMSSNLTLSTGNVTVLLPCATITTAKQIVVTGGTRNVSLRGCAMRGGSAASGSQGGTAFAYTGTGAMVQVGDASYAADTPGFHLDNVVINTTGATSASAQGLTAYRTQEMDLEGLYLLGNGNQTGMTLDGTGNYTGGTFLDDQIGGYQVAVNAIGHQVTNAATTDWLNASAFVRLHIDCPTSGGSPISGTVGINLQQGDGNTFTGGDVEGCSTALHLGANAQNNTIVGLRNENSTSQVVADAGSSYNNWMTGGTMFTGQLTDNGTRNSFLDTFHRSFNGLNGDWYGSQQDATVTNHFRLGVGSGNERGLLNRYQSDFGYRWTTGLSDATSGEQFYQILDELNNVYRFQVGQYNHGQASTNNQTVINAAGTGAVVLNGSNNAGTGGVVIGSGGASATTVATVSNAGNAQFNGTMQVGGTTQSTGTMTVRNSANAEVDYYLWPGLTSSQKGSFTYKDWNGNSQWYLVKDTSNNWAVNSAVGGLDSFKAYQSTNSGDTYVNASNSTGHIRLNYEGGSGAETDIYSGSSSSLAAAFLGPTSIKFPGLAAGSGHYCLQIDNSGYITNTGTACGTGTGGGGGGNGTINSGNPGAIAYYTTSGTVIGGEDTVPISAGGTGASTAATAVSNLLPGTAADGQNGITVSGTVSAGAVTGKVLGGFTYASQNQAAGNDGIANALAAAAGRPATIVADPSYASTEKPSVATLTANSLHYQDSRLGLSVDYYHNPSNHLWNWPDYNGDIVIGQQTDCMYDLNSSPITTKNCFALGLTSIIPGFSRGNDAVGQQGWQITSAMPITTRVNGSGIAESITAVQTKTGSGDNALQYNYLTGWGGWNGTSDEGTKAFASDTNEDPHTYTGACNSGCTAGSTTIKATGITDSGLQGTYQYLIDTTQPPLTNTIAAIGSGLGSGLSAVTLGTPLSSGQVSIAWGTLVGDVATPVNPVTPYTTSEPFSVTVVSGTFNSTSPICFTSQQHEQAIPTLVSLVGGVQSMTAPLHGAHAAGTYVFQGGMCGYGIEATALTQSPAGQPLRYLMDVVGSTSSSVIQATVYAGGGNFPVPLPNISAQNVTVSSASSCAGTVCTFPILGGTLYHPETYPGVSVTIAGMSNSAMNTTCTGATFTGASPYTLNCTIAGLTGSNTTSTGGTYTLTGLNGINLWPMSEVLDVENQSTQTVDGSFLIEPNVIAFASGDTIEETHGTTGNWNNATEALVVYSPIAGVNGHQITVAGSGATGGGASPSYNAILKLNNNNPDSYYAQGGGWATPPNGIVLQGDYEEGILVDHGPASGQSFAYLNTDAFQYNDPNYYYNMFSASGNGGGTSLRITPYSNNTTFVTGGVATWNAASHTFNGVVNGANGFQLSGSGGSAGRCSAQMERPTTLLAVSITRQSTRMGQRRRKDQH